jgi:hypothetical protein
MSCLYLYAVAAPPTSSTSSAPATAVRGFEDREVSWRPAGGLLAAVARLERTPTVELESLRAHDRVVRGLSASVAALLPMRFGQALGSEADLEASIARAGARLRPALAAVEGCAQMTLRVCGERDAAPAGGASGADAPDDDGLGPGARYLAARARASAPPPGVTDALAPLLDALAPRTRAHRVERGRAPGLLASIYHLVPNEDLEAYAQVLERHRAALAPLRLRASGPWPPYAFAEASLEPGDAEDARVG